MKVITIEDNELLRMALSSYIDNSEEFELVEGFEDCESALEFIKEYPVDIVLMDIGLKGMNGIEGTKAIKLLKKRIEVLIITVFENSEMVFAALEAGASGYLTKTFTEEELIDALRLCRDGGAPMSTKVAKMVVRSFEKNHSSPLSEREKEVLDGLSLGLSYNSIAEKLFISVETVKFHLKNIYIKLEVSSRQDALETARKKRFI